MADDRDPETRSDSCAESGAESEPRADSDARSAADSSSVVDSGSCESPGSSPSQAYGPPDPPFPIVGIGASAGGMAALKEFFHEVPADSGLAYVIVVHLSTEHESHLSELLQPHASIPVRQVNATVPLERNHAYIIPPGANLSTLDSHLRLTEIEPQRRERAPIDHFFRTRRSRTAPQRSA